MRKKRIGVLGIGDVLHGDYAIGPYVIKVLEAFYEVGDEVFMLDVGSTKYDLRSLVSSLDALIVIDPVHAEAQPGTVLFYTQHELFGTPPAWPDAAHDSNLRKALSWARSVRRVPKEILLIGVVPDRRKLDLGLSLAVRRALPRVELEVLEGLALFGVQAQKRIPPNEPDIWWEELTEAAEGKKTLYRMLKTSRAAGIS